MYYIKLCSFMFIQTNAYHNAYYDATDVWQFSNKKSPFAHQLVVIPTPY
jgi:hypothetical protein